MKKALYLAILLLFIAISGVSGQNKKAKSSSKPNIIFILADDLGIGDVSCYGSDNNKTPIIDKLAAEGMRFQHAYTAPLCGPSRSRILTGRYAFRTGAVNQDRVGEIKPENEVMIPAVLKSAGYTSALVGKWSQFGLTPKDFGFDDYITFQGSGVYWSKEKAKASTYTENGIEKPLNTGVYMPDLMHNHLVDFLTVNKNKPFFLYYSMVHVHSLIQPTPDSKPGSDLYADNTTYMDKLVGKLLATLDDLKLRENTLIVFMGDNGTANQYAARGTIGGKALSGKKGTMLECGSLVPTIASWPGVIKAGQVNTDLIDSSDLLPTFAEVCGAPLPTKNILDGRSFLPQLKGRKGNPKEYIFMELGNKWYVRSAKWKLNRAGELFDMTNAPFEEKLVADYANNPEASAAYARLQAVLKELAPEKGILDDGDGSGRHASNVNKKKGAKEDKDSE
ncbi:sulfatase-like hydrolase/transferase [Flavobacterium nackdongense]|nr:sulfatase-like hydrolase/transferase [Flavobacterium nackdongense]